MKHVLMELMDCTYYLNTKKSSVMFDFWFFDVTMYCYVRCDFLALDYTIWIGIQCTRMHKAAKKERRFAFNKRINNIKNNYKQGNHFVSSRERVSNPNFRTKLILGRVLLPVSYSASPIHIGSMNCLYVYINTYLMLCWHFLD